jgi:hypothetical protein
MKVVTLCLDDILYPFYEKIGRQVGKTPEEVMADALFRFAGESSLQAIDRKKRGR